MEIEQHLQTGQQEARTRWGTEASGAAFDKKKTSILTAQAQAFIAQQVICVLAGQGRYQEAQGLITLGMPGFVQTPDQHTCLLPLERRMMTSHLVQGLFEAWRSGHAPRIGLCFIRHTTRERLCVHGRAYILPYGSPDHFWIHLRVTEAFFHCPKYIRTQVAGLTMLEGEDPLRQPGERIKREGCNSMQLTPELQSFIEQQRLCFLCTVNRRGQAAVNHRGGAPGFLVTQLPTQASPGGLLLLPDYAGNGAFEAIGNILETEQAALIIPDYVHHLALCISGRACVLEPEQLHSTFRQRCKGAQRIIALAVQQIERQGGDWTAPLAYERARVSSMPVELPSCVVQIR